MLRASCSCFRYGLPRIVRDGLTRRARWWRPPVPVARPHLLLRQPDRAAGGGRPARRPRRPRRPGQRRDPASPRSPATCWSTTACGMRYDSKEVRRHPDHGQRQPPRHRRHPRRRGRRRHDRRPAPGHLLVRGREPGDDLGRRRAGRPRRHRRRQQGRGGRHGAGRCGGPNTGVFAPVLCFLAYDLGRCSSRRSGAPPSASTWRWRPSAPASPPAGCIEPDAKVASLASPPASVLAKLVLKTSHNRGAESLDVPAGGQGGLDDV